MKKMTLQNKLCHRNAFLVFILCATTMMSLRINAQDSSLRIHYSFEKGTVADSVTDNSGNGYTGALKNGATVRKIGRFNVLDLGAMNGYLDMGKKPGRLFNH